MPPFHIYFAIIFFAIAAFFVIFALITLMPCYAATLLPPPLFRLYARRLIIRVADVAFRHAAATRCLLPHATPDFSRLPYAFADADFRLLMMFIFTLI